MAETSLATKEQIIDAVRRLGPDDRAEVLYALNETFAVGQLTAEELVAEGFTPEVLAEFERRYQAMQDDSGSVVTWEQLQAELRQRYGDDFI